MEFTRLPGESELELLWRVASSKKQNNLTWDQVGAIMNELTESQKTESSWRKKFASMTEDLEVDKVVESPKEIDTTLPSDDISVRIRELEKQRKKLQTEKIEYNKWLREEARDEMIKEEIVNAITTLPPMSLPQPIIPVHNNKSWLLCISDAHYGVEFEIKDFFGNTLNAYSPEIFEERMQTLFNCVLEKIEENNITELTIMELGDAIDGMLRLTSQLMKLRYGIIESAIRYAYYLATWLNELSKYTRIKFHMVKDSNHNQLRLLGAPKNAFPEENMSKVIMTVIEERTKNNPNITILSNDTGMCYAMMSTYCVVGLHGEKKNLQKNLLELSHLYAIHIDYTVSGHMHHEAMKETGFDSAVLSVGSIVGVDGYSMSLNATSNASCSMFEFELGKGRTAEYIFKLN